MTITMIHTVSVITASLSANYMAEYVKIAIVNTSLNFGLEKITDGIYPKKFKKSPRGRANEPRAVFC